MTDPVKEVLDKIFELAQQTQEETDVEAQDETGRIATGTTKAYCPNCAQSMLSFRYEGFTRGGIMHLTCPNCKWTAERSFGACAETREEYEESYQEAYRIGGPAFAEQQTRW